MAFNGIAQRCIRFAPPGAECKNPEHLAHVTESSDAKDELMKDQAAKLGAEHHSYAERLGDGHPEAHGSGASTDYNNS